MCLEVVELGEIKGLLDAGERRLALRKCFFAVDCRGSSQFVRPASRLISRSGTALHRSGVSSKHALWSSSVGRQSYSRFITLMFTFGKCLASKHLVKPLRDRRVTFSPLSCDLCCTATCSAQCRKILSATAAAALLAAVFVVGGKCGSYSSFQGRQKKCTAPSSANLQSLSGALDACLGRDMGQALSGLGPWHTWVSWQVPCSVEMVSCRHLKGPQ